MAKVKREGPSPFPRPEIQQMLTQVVSGAIKALGIGIIYDTQRDHHRVYRALIRIAARVGLRMGYDLQEHIELVAELFIKSEAELADLQAKLPMGVQPQFHNVVLDPAQILEKAKLLPPKKEKGK
jgi:hypothetical protein